MACVTLKRGAHFDPLGNSSLSPKRRRFSNPLSQTYIPAPTQRKPSPFVPEGGLTPEQLTTRIRQEVRRLQRRRLIPRFHHSTGENGHLSGTDSDSDSSSVGNHGESRSCKATIAPSTSNSHESMQPLQCFPTETNNTVQTVTSSSPMCPISAISPRSPTIRPDAALFSLRQVNAICDRLVSEREDELREQYDKVLSCKLAEQYEAFLKFNHDQLYKRFQDAPMSYVS